MPAVTAPLLGFLLGAFFAWLSTDDLGRAEGSLKSDSIWLAASFGLLVYAPAAAYFLASAPDWAFGYVVDTQRLPPITTLGLTLICAASCPVGFMTIAGCLRKPAIAARVAAVPAVVVIAVCMLTVRRLAVYATYTEYHGDFGIEPVTGSPLGYALLWATAVVSAGVFWTATLLRRIGAQVRRE